MPSRRPSVLRSNTRRWKHAVPFSALSLSVMLVVGAVLIGGGTPVPASGASVASSSKTVDGNSFQGDTCVSATDCWAVGWVYIGGVTGVNCTTTGNACIPLVEN